ncbi:MAG TPA: immunoglobulin domain-containing protein, partial [Opitutaceae bacterium]|nr:immunoglobulin domain-containing protein [Opitutaceae bacterium]
GIAADNSGNFYVADTNNQTVRLAFFPAPPAITTQPLTQSVAIGSSAKFTVTTSGRPTPSYQWFLNGSAISGATASTLNLASVAAADAGAYTVTATNNLGSVTSNPANLNVYTVPTAPAASGHGGGALGGGFVLALALLGLARRAARRPPA